MRRRLRRSTQRAQDWFEHEGIAPAQRRLTRTVDMRYAGQNYELSSRCPKARFAGNVDGSGAGFAAAHQRMYGFVAEEEPVQLVTFRVEASGTGAARRRSRLTPMPARMLRRDHAATATCGCRNRAAS